MTTKVAIALQGGGTHAAFSWGVLTRILETKKKWDSDGEGPSFDVTAFSGTSAGALCALAAWYGLVPNCADADCGTIDKAIERLDFLWHTFAAATPIEQSVNTLVAAMLEMKKKGVPLSASDPYSVSTNLALLSLSVLGARQQYLSFAALLDSLCPDFDHVDWHGVSAMKCRMLAGAIEIHSGNFEVFDSHKTLEQLRLRPVPEEKDQYQTTRWRMRRPLSLEGVAASGTLPDVLPAQRIPNTSFPTCNSDKQVQRDAFYWDGLYSQNPPVRSLLDDSIKEEKPDEIWVVRINPQETYREVMSLEDVKDRVNDLAGNVSLNAELDHILSVNRWLTKYGDRYPPLADRKIVTVRTIKMRRETAWGLPMSTKLDRSRPHLERLYKEGREVAQTWLRDWRIRGANFDSYPDDARYPEKHQ